MAEKSSLHILLNNEIPFHGTFEEFEKFSKFFESLVNKVKESESPREIIFDTWFLYDFYIRKKLLQAFNLTRYENEDLDLMYDFLPQSFDSCVKALENLIKNQKDIYTNKKHSFTYFENYPQSITFQGHFLFFLAKEHPGLYKSLSKSFDGFLKDREPAYYEFTNNSDTFDKYDIVSRTWLEHCEKLNTDWFDSVRKLNKCRNKAAHIYDDSSIYKTFGIQGENKLQLLKKTITDLLKNTMNFEIK